MSVTKTFSRDMGRLAIDPDQAGLVAGYDMVPDGVTLEDKSGNGNHGTISGAAFEFTEIGPSMKFDGLVDVIACGTGFQALTDLTVSFWVDFKTAPATGWVLNYYLSTVDRWGIRITDPGGGNATLDIFDDIDDVGTIRYQTTLHLNIKHHIAVQMDNLENKLFIDGELIGSGEFSSDYWSSFAGLLFIGAGNINQSFVNTNISNVKIFNLALTAAEIQAEYQAGAKAINWKSDYGVDVSIAAESTPGELSNSVARIESGSHIMTTDTINGKTCKVIECVTAGVVQIPTAYFHGNDTQAAHGGFEWWMNKVSAGSSLKIFFIANEGQAPEIAGSNGYFLRASSSEAITLIKATNGSSIVLNSTSSDFLDINTWNKIDIKRNSSGSFYSYLNDELITVTVGTNPVTDTDFTTSKHVVLDLDAGDKIAWAAPNGDCAITKYQGVV